MRLKSDKMLSSLAGGLLTHTLPCTAVASRCTSPTDAQMCSISAVQKDTAAIDCTMKP